MQLLRKHGSWNLAVLRRSRRCIKISVKGVIMHRYRNLFTIIFQNNVQITLSLKVVVRKNFIAEFSHLKMGIPNFRVKKCFRLQGESQVEGFVLVSLDSPYPRRRGHIGSK